MANVGSCPLSVTEHTHKKKFYRQLRTASSTLGCRPRLSSVLRELLRAATPVSTTPLVSRNRQSTHGAVGGGADARFERNRGKQNFHSMVGNKRFAVVPGPKAGAGCAPRHSCPQQPWSLTGCRREAVPTPKTRGKPTGSRNNAGRANPTARSRHNTSVRPSPLSPGGMAAQLVLASKYL